MTVVCTGFAVRTDSPRQTFPRKQDIPSKIVSPAPPKRNTRKFVPLNVAETSTTRRGCRSLLRSPSVLWRDSLAARFRPLRWRCRQPRLPIASAARRRACTRPAAAVIGKGSWRIASDLPPSGHAGSRCPELSRKDRTGRKGRRRLQQENRSKIRSGPLWRERRGSLWV